MSKNEIFSDNGMYKVLLVFPDGTAQTIAENLTGVRDDDSCLETITDDVVEWVDPQDWARDIEVLVAQHHKTQQKKR